MQLCKKRLVAILLLPLLAAGAYAQITFQKLIGGTASTFGESVIEVSSGGYLATGSYPEDGGGGKSNLYLVRTDSLGDTLWTRHYGDSEDDIGYAVTQTQDGNFAAAGTSKRFVNGNWQNDAYLLKFDDNGDTLWTFRYGGLSKDIIYDMQETSDGGFILTGFTESFGNPTGGALILRTDLNGTLLWLRHYLVGYSSVLHSVRESPDGGFICAGTSRNANSASDGDLLLFKFNANGDSVWAKNFGGTGFEEGNAVVVAPDDNYLAVGYAQSNASGDKNIFLVKTDSTGATLWSKVLGGSSVEVANDVQNVAGGGFILSGTTTAPGNWYTDLYLVMIDDQGDTLWTRTYGGSFIDAARSVRPTLDGGFIMAGYSTSFGVSSLKLYLLKTNGLGLVSRDIWFANQPLTLYPQPAGTHLFVEWPPHAHTADLTFEIIDLQGRTLHKTQPGESKIEVSHFQPGLYLYRIVENGRVLGTGKWLKGIH